jgi:hypothetical protein
MSNLNNWQEMSIAHGAAIDVLDRQILTANQSIAILQAGLTADDTAISTLQANVSANTTAISSLQGLVSANITSISTINDSLSDITQQVNSLFCNVKYPPVPYNAAKGDSTTDDYAALQAMLDGLPEESTMFLPADPTKHYRINTGLVNSRGIKMLGESMYGSIIKNYGTGDAVTLKTYEFAKIEELCVTAVSGGTSGNGIVFDDIVTVCLERAFVSGHGGHNITKNMSSLSNINNIYIDHCDIRDAYGDGINLIGTLDLGTGQVNTVHITGNNIAENIGNGISIWGANIVIDGANTIQNNDGYGIEIKSRADDHNAAAQGVVIEGNYFEIDKAGFIHVYASTASGHVSTVVGLRIIGNFGIMANTQVNVGVTSLVTIEYPEKSGVGTAIRNLTFDNPAFTSSTLNIIDANDVLMCDSVIKIPYAGDIGYVDMGFATILSKKYYVVDCSNAQGATYDIATGYAVVSGNVDIIYPVDIRSYQNIYKVAVYVKTDSTNYNISMSLYGRNAGIDVDASYTELVIKSRTAQTGSQSFEQAPSSALDNVYAGVDLYLKISITLTTPGTYFRLGKPYFILSQ